LERLEVNIEYLHALERTKRIDAEFYSTENIEMETRLRKLKSEDVTQLATVSDGNHMSISNKFIEEGVPYYRGQDIHFPFIESSAPICIDEKTYGLPLMKRSHLKKGDVLLSIVGTIGGVSLVTTDDMATCSCKLAILRPNKILGEYLMVYLSSKYGQAQIKRFTRGAVQKGFILEDMDQLQIYTASAHFQNAIHDVVQKSEKCLEQATCAYKDAEDIIIEELNLQNYIPRKEQISVRTLQDILNYDRMDAEYFQPKYEQIKGMLSNYDSSMLTLGDVADYIFTGEYADEYLSYCENKTIHYIRGEDINSGNVLSNNDCCVEPDKYSKFANIGDIVTGRVGTLGRFGVITEETQNSLCSDNVLCFHLPIQYIPEAYTVYFNLPIIREFILRESRGSVQQRLNQETLRTILIPLIDVTTQNSVKENFIESKRLKKESEDLLALAKRAVEIAIEQDENVATEYLDNTIN